MHPFQVVNILLMGECCNQCQKVRRIPQPGWQRPHRQWRDAAAAEPHMNSSLNTADSIRFLRDILCRELIYFCLTYEAAVE